MRSEFLGVTPSFEGDEVEVSELVPSFEGKQEVKDEKDYSSIFNVRKIVPLQLPKRKCRVKP